MVYIWDILCSSAISHKRIKNVLVFYTGITAVLLLIIELKCITVTLAYEFLIYKNLYFVFSIPLDSYDDSKKVFEE